jgi:hypothetical protein
MPALPKDYPDFGLTPEQRREAVYGHYYETPGMDGERGEIWAYTDRVSYRPGETLTLHVSATARSFDLAIHRDGADLVPVFSARGIEARWQDTPDQCSVEGCGWAPTWELRIPPEWPSGAYRFTLTAEGRDGARISCHHLIILCPPRGRREGRLVQVAATGTWLAYNTFGGSNHYQGITGPERNQFATRVSTQRPWCRGFVVLPPAAPRVPLEVDLPPLAAPRYPHMEWAYATGHSKKYASAGWASYDGHFFRWAERAGYAIDLISQNELQSEPGCLSDHACAVFTGHDEYWSWEMRDAVDSFVERGGGAARFAGNFLWQTRIENEGRTQVCYKYRARAEDPAYRQPDTSRTTNAWEAPEVGRPGALTFGLNSTSGVYAGWGGCTPRGVRGFPIYRPHHWAFRNTGLYYGDVLGAESHIYGYEVDGLDFTMRRGLPYPTGEGSPPEGLEILALGMASLVEENADVPPGWLADEDAVFTAQTLYGEATPDTLDKVKRGNGMIVSFPKGKGQVFHAGTCEWVAGLLRKDAMVETVTANVLERFLGR